jgi:hypothetical protein
MRGIGTMFDQILKFEQKLAEFTGAPYAVMTDCCTHAIELCLRYDRVRECQFTAYTYLSIPMTMHKLQIQYELVDESWVGQYQFHNTRIWDSARILQSNMTNLSTLDTAVLFFWMTVWPMTPCCGSVMMAGT